MSLKDILLINKNRQLNFAKEIKMSVLTFKESHSKKNCSEKVEKIVAVVIEIPDTEKKPINKKAPKAEEPKVEAPAEEAPKAEEAKPEEKSAPKAKKSSKK